MAAQPHGRDRGTKTTSPTIQRATINIIDETGRAREAILHYGLAPEILPHISSRPDLHLDMGGSDLAKVQRLLHRLSDLLVDHVSLNRKDSSQGAPYTFTILEFRDGQYSVVGEGCAERPGEAVLWLEHLQDGDLPAVIERNENSIAVKVSGGDATAAANLLSAVRANIPSFAAGLAGQTTLIQIDQPTVSVRMLAVPPTAYTRFLAKIGFNMLVHHYGAGLARAREFDAVCMAILNDAELRWDLPQTTQLAECLRRVLDGRHWLTVWPTEVGLGLFCSLYAGPVTSVALSTELPSGFPNEPIFYVVDYVSHEARRMSTIDIAIEAQRKGIAMPQAGGAG
ncbi:hypothetical protein ACDA63_18750 [Uliginosibacterium sp. sgz301328]|uniref:hypothetical protein n=1 Tax=Uliginosibacterium sp. sgz301328 TaxID=3243764 RepID=UPI00359E2D64